MEKKVPMRTCIACKTVKPKKELIRIVKSEDGIMLDRTGRKNGRGAYMCDNPECVNKLVKQKSLNRTFEMPVSEETYAKILEDFFGEEK